MTGKLPARKCLWGCNSDRRITHEHVIPRSCGQILVQGYRHPNVTVLLRSERVAPDGRTLVGRVKTTPKPAMTVRRLCADCNNGWMSELDHKILVLLEPMILGKRVEIAGRPAPASEPPASCSR